MFAIQYLDHDEGSRALWNDLTLPHFNTRDEARAKLREIRAKDSQDDYLSYSYRIAEVGSELYYSQPTDKLEY